MRTLLVPPSLDLADIASESLRPCCSIDLLAECGAANGDPSPPASDGVWVRARDLGGVLKGSSGGVGIDGSAGGARGSLCAGALTGLTRLYLDMLLEIDSFIGGATGLEAEPAVLLTDRYLENLGSGGSLSDDMANLNFSRAVSKE